MDEQVKQSFDRWAYANIDTFTTPGKREFAWEAWQACAAALSQPAAAWQPIETAPKDGSSILAFWACSLNCVPVTGDNCYAMTLWSGGDWISTDLSDISFSEPTHWMPLPAAPEATP